MLTQEYLKSTFSYVDGNLIWKIKKTDKIIVGSVAGCVTKSGRCFIGLDGKDYRTHRLIYLFHHGFLPKIIDHIDGDPSNNRIENLREATIRENSYNRTKQKNNTSGYKGVYLHKATKKWVAYCSGNSLGYYDTPEEANNIVKEFREKLHCQYAKH